FYYGKFIRHTPISDFQITAYHTHENIDLNDLKRYPSFATIGSYQNVDRLDDFDEAWMLAPANEEKTQYVFAHVRRSIVRERGWYYPDYHYVLISEELAKKYFNQLDVFAQLTQNDNIAQLYDRISPKEQKI